MRKYMAAARVMFKAQSVYRFDVAMTAVGAITRIIFAWVVWGAAFSGRETIGGYTFQAMLSYYVASSFLASAIYVATGVSAEVQARIRDGTFSKYMVIPANPLLYFVGQNIGVAAYYAIWSAFAAIFGVAAFGVELSLPLNFMSIVCAFLMALAGIAFMVSYHFLIGVLAFKFQEIGFIRHMQGAIVEFLTGSVVPLSMLPGFVRPLPFAHVIYAPAMLLTGRAGAREGLWGLLSLMAWTAAAMAAGQAMYDRLRVKYDGAGI